MSKPKWTRVEAGDYEYRDEGGLLGGASLEYAKHGKLGYRWSAFTFNEWIGWYGRLRDAKLAVELALAQKGRP